MTNKYANRPLSRKASRIRSRIGQRSLVLVGLMGAGKSTIGKRLAAMLELKFCDTDHEIEAVSQMTVSELFAIYGEQEFRDLERRVILRLLDEGPMILATGGGAFINADIRQAISRKGLSVWLSADIDVLMDRVARRDNRPLLKTGNPRAVMQRLMEERYPVYTQADITIQSRNTHRDKMVRDVIKAVDLYLSEQEEIAADEN